MGWGLVFGFGVQKGGVRVRVRVKVRVRVGVRVHLADLLDADQRCGRVGVLGREDLVRVRVRG